MFLDCPAYLDRDGAVRCGLPAEVRCRFTMRSTDGPVESAMIRCPAGHYFCGAIESLTWDGKDKHDPGPAAVTPRAGRDSVPGSHQGGVGGIAVRDFPAKPEPEISRPNTAPAYYLGHPARLWITIMRPRRRHTTSHHSMRAITGGGKQTPSRQDGPHRRQSRNRQRAPCSHVVAGHAGAVMPGSPPDPGRPAGPVLVTGASGTIGRRLVRHWWPPVTRCGP